MDLSIVRGYDEFIKSNPPFIFFYFRYKVLWINFIAYTTYVELSMQHVSMQNSACIQMKPIMWICVAVRFINVMHMNILNSLMLWMRTFLPKLFEEFKHILPSVQPVLAPSSVKAAYRRPRLFALKNYIRMNGREKVSHTHRVMLILIIR